MQRTAARRAAARRAAARRAAALRAFPPTRCLQCVVAASLGRYAAPGKHVVSAAPQPAAPTYALKRLSLDPPPTLPPVAPQWIRLRQRSRSRRR